MSQKFTERSLALRTQASDDLKSRHITPADGNVFADLGFSPAQAAAMLVDADARIAKSQKLKWDAAVAIAQWSGGARDPAD